MKTDYTSRLKIPLIEDLETKFYTHSGQIVAVGYNRIVIGDRGPYIEFEPHMIYRTSLFMPEDQMYRLTDPSVYYLEYRTIDAEFVKVYFQLKTVNYADYLIRKCYISPFDIKTIDGPIIEKLRK
jgi:hypothetical protein